MKEDNPLNALWRVISGKEQDDINELDLDKITGGTPELIAVLKREKSRAEEKHENHFKDELYKKAKHNSIKYSKRTAKSKSQQRAITRANEGQSQIIKDDR